ncbi:MAG: sigma-54 dependent transcriptional regulator [Desulfobacterales bacterium]|jgi:DNA-binding NtrC family response regulator
MKTVVLLSRFSDHFSTLNEGLPSARHVHLRDVDEALNWVEKQPADYLFLDLDMLGGGSQPLTADTFKALFARFWRRRPALQFILLTSADGVGDAVAAVKSGASGYLKSPVMPEEVRLAAKAADEDIIKDSEIDYLREQFWEADDRETIRTECQLMRTVFAHIRSVAPTRTTVLLTGETGTGKSLLAKLIHRHSNRKDAQFISVHCGAIPDTLIESDLFGHEKGSFTGADRRKLGKFEIANGGTIFLDEVGTLTPSTQIKLLMVLQEGLFQRVGGETTYKTDVRVIAATNGDLQAMSENGQFRKDLYYRLNVFPIHLPSLRARKGDIAHLVTQFIDRLNALYAKEIRGVHPIVLDALGAYEWPGNIRELENVIERAYILETSHTLSPESFPSDFFDDRDMPAELMISSEMTLAQTRCQGIQEIERQYLKGLLARHSGRINQSAAEAGITPRQLHKLMKKYGLQKEDFKPPFRKSTSSSSA